MQSLLKQILAYPGVPERWRQPDLGTPPTLVLPFGLNVGGRTARYFSPVTTLEKPQGVTLQELHVEVFHRADSAPPPAPRPSP